MKDTLEKYILNDCVAIQACSTTMVCEDARNIHATFPVCTAALGRTLTGAILMGSMLKNDADKITISINGGGPAGTVLATVNSKLEVKGCIDYPQVNLPATDNGKLDVGGAVGTDGFITVVKDIGLKEPYIGKTALKSGEIAEDLAYYYLMSEQQPSIVCLGVWVETDCTVLRAGGIIISPMPNADDDVLTEIENRLFEISNYTLMLMSMSPDQAVNRIFAGMDLKHMATMYPKYMCDCSRERLEQVVIALGNEEIQSMIDEDGAAEIVCRFCNKKYNFDKNDLIKLKEEAK